MARSIGGNKEIMVAELGQWLLKVPETQQDLVMERKEAEWTSRFLAEVLAELKILNNK